MTGGDSDTLNEMEGKCAQLRQELEEVLSEPEGCCTATATAAGDMAQGDQCEQHGTAGGGEEACEHHNHSHDHDHHDHPTAATGAADASGEGGFTLL